jgi:hypothetical protein
VRLEPWCREREQVLFIVGPQPQVLEYIEIIGGIEVAGKNSHEDFSKSYNCFADLGSK